MDIKNIESEVNQRLDKLRKKEVIKKKNSLIKEYEEVCSKIKTLKIEIDTLVENMQFDEAAELKSSMKNLENKKEVLHSAYEKYKNTPDFEDDDLISLCRELSNAAHDKFEELDQEIMELLEKALTLQQEKVCYSNICNKCRKTIISNSVGGLELRNMMKFPKIHENSLENIQLNFKDALTAFINKR